MEGSSVYEFLGYRIVWDSGIGGLGRCHSYLEEQRRNTKAYKGRRADSIKWLPCWVFGHVDPGVVDYERGDHCICERCGKRLD